MSNPLMDFLTQLSGQSDNIERNTLCEDRVFCEMAVIGSRPDAEVLNKMLWKIANEWVEILFYMHFKFIMTRLKLFCSQFDYNWLICSRKF